MFPNVIRWTGSKRLYADGIIYHFPRKIQVYYEPFIGSGAVLRSLLESDILVKEYIVSDICQPLILLWKEIQKHPIKLAKQYRSYWRELKNNRDFYYIIRKEFNTDKSNVYAFLFLLRTCTNGLIRFNSKGDFNTSLHVNRDGIKPKTLRDILVDWSKAIQNVEFICQSYSKVCPNKKDFIFLDPPYFNTKDIYYGDFDSQSFFSFLKNLKCSYAMTYDGYRNENLKYKLDKSLYDSHFLLKSAKSSFSRLFNDEEVIVSESLYLKGIRKCLF